MKQEKILLSLLVTIFTFCSCDTITQRNEILTITCTTGHIADLVKNVTGTKAKVTALMGPGVDPHLYKASLHDLKLLQQSDIIFFNGLHLEGKMGEVFHKLSRTKNVQAVSDGIPKDSLLMADAENHIPDPHIWFDILLWSYCLDKVYTDIIAFDPANKNYYEKRYLNYKKELLNLNGIVTLKLREIPEDERLLVTAHDAFGYFGRRYNVEVIGLQGISTLSEYGLNEITTLAKLLITRKVRAVFVETSVSEKAIQSVIEGCKQKGHIVKIGGNLYSDALGDPNAPEGTYVGMLEHNVNALVKSLKK